jgi:hypothetical protein
MDPSPFYVGLLVVRLDLIKKSELADLDSVEHRTDTNETLEKINSFS